MSPEASVSAFVAKEYAAAGIEVRGTAPGLVTVALPFHVDDIDDFITHMREKFDASVDFRATERGVELDVFPQSLQDAPPPQRWCCCSLYVVAVATGVVAALTTLMAVALA